MKANINLFNGLGDKCLDLIGFFVICKHLNYKPNITFLNDGKYEWGGNNYDMRLFEFSSITFNEQCDFYIRSINPSSSLSPYKVYLFVKQFVPITFEEISNDFITSAKHVIRPSSIISQNIPNLENTYGVHLRKTDKVVNNGDIRHENSLSEFDIIIQKLLEDIEYISIHEPNSSFLIVSEDNNWKKEIEDKVLKFGAKIIKLDYTNNNYSNYNSVLDMFCLSKCKEILQGVKYSTFSILASLLGNGKLINYAHHTDTYDKCLIHSWNSVIDINNEKNFNIDIYDKVTQNVVNIYTNINCINPIN